jgi:hypothetical protein
MEVNRIRLLCAIVGFTFGFAPIGARPLAAQTDCKAVFQAMDKIHTTPTHGFSTSSASANAKPHTAETIYFDGTIYVNVSGKWTRSRMTSADMAQQEKENRRNSKSTCRYLKDESVNGEAAAVWEVRSENEDAKSSGQVWISKSRGLPLRSETDVEIAGGGPDKAHYSVRYEFANVQPPPL